VIVAAAFLGREGIVYVSEKRSSVVAEARQSLFIHALAVVALAAIAAIIVNAVLRRVISHPMSGLVTALRGVEQGDLSVIAEGQTCQELTYLADQINSMTRSLEASERDRRFQMEKAREIQQHLLPKDQEYNGLRVAILFEPAEDVGGDYFDVLALSEHQYLLCVADVTGHGVPAAMAAAVIKTLVQEAAEVSQSPAAILARVNHRYTEIMLPGHLATMVALVVDARQCTVTYANAGHEPPFLQLPSGEIERLMTADLLLGVIDDVTYEDDSVAAPSGTKIVLVSDGVTEAFDPDETQFGTNRVLAAIETSKGMSADDVVDRFVADLNSFRRSRSALDDTTLVVAEVLGEQQQELEIGTTLRTA
jgi:sigma-B regulation protein RsbU (phosphoserine phosphatase)